VPSYNRMSTVSKDWAAGTVNTDDIVDAQMEFAESCRIVARHIAASTVLNLDARLPKGMWRITRDAANAAGATREANRPPETRLVRGWDDLAAHATWYAERNLLNHDWNGLYNELERLLTDTFAPQKPSYM
jgi:hypothetical protein